MTKIKESYDCSLVLTHDLIGGKWKLRILWHIFHGDTRFSELRRNIPEITEKVLYTNLRELEGSGVIQKTVEEGQAVKAVFYSLSEKYSELESIVNAICDFSTKYAEKNNIELVGNVV